MNKFQLIGTVSYFEVKEFPKEDRVIKKCNWMLNCKIGNQFNNLPCESWNHSFENLMNGMVIELTDYIPKNNRYQDKVTAQWVSRFVIDVKEARVVFEEEVGGRGLVVNQTTTPQTQPIVTQPTTTFKQNVTKFDVNKEIEKLLKDETIQEEQLEEVIDLDWEEDTKKEWEEQQKETINEIEKELEEPKSIDELLQASVSTKSYEIENDNKIEQLSQRVVTQEELNKINNIPKIQEELPYEGDLNVPGAKFIKEDW